MKTLLLDIDSLRPDHIGAHGYARETTPHIDSLAADGVRFESAYVANSPCLPSRAALLTGRYGVDTGIVTHGPDSQSIEYPATKKTNPWAGSWQDMIHSPSDWYTLSELCYHDQMHTVAVSSFPRHPAPWFHRTWHAFEYPQEPAGTDESFQTVRGEQVADRVNAQIRRHAHEDFFLYAQFWDPHAPYNRSAAENEQFESTPTPPYPTAEQIASHQSWETWRSATQMGITDRDSLQSLLNGYDAEIRYVDQQIGAVLDALRQEGIYDETLIVLTADHGEEFGEHGAYREHWSVYDGTQRVPLIIKPPADEPVSRGERTDLVVNVDIAPTIADYAGLSMPDSWHGVSLRDAVAGRSELDRAHIVFEHGLYTAQRGIRTERWKYIETYDTGMWDEFVPVVQLFDCEDDPWEQHNCRDTHPDVCDELAAQLTEWKQTHVPERGDALADLAQTGPAGNRWAERKLE
ncbi:MAG: arylsulfatase A related enzyme [Haloquadratum sp. J07HQX50]|nr:MAG: arylsulfatase A related enzyme [Haloquadratum sp. J07HQX50]